MVDLDTHGDLDQAAVLDVRGRRLEEEERLLRHGVLELESVRLVVSAAR